MRIVALQGLLLLLFTYIHQNIPCVWACTMLLILMVKSWLDAGKSSGEVVPCRGQSWV